MKNPFFKIMAALFAAGIFILFACGEYSVPPYSGAEQEGTPNSNGDDNGGGDGDDNGGGDGDDNGGEPSGIGLFCDYGPVTQYGGGCFEMKHADDCDLEWGEVVSNCGSNAVSSSSVPKSSSSVPKSSSSVPKSSSSVTSGGVKYCDYGPVTQYGGGCFKMDNDNDCDLEWGNVVTSCPSNSTASSSSVKVTVSSSSNSPGIVYGSLTYSEQTYKTVKIGTQTWMAENLNYNAEGSKCSNCTTYGRLYDWKTANNVCPSGWHLPSNAEWATLIDYVGNSSGTKLKATSGWNSYDGVSGNGTDNYGFSALPGGYNAGSYLNSVGYGGYWWSATEFDASNAYFRLMVSDALGSYVMWQNGDKSILRSVRCVKN